MKKALSLLLVLAILLPAAANALNMYDTVYATTSVNVRSGPGTNTASSAGSSAATGLNGLEAKESGGRSDMAE